MTNFLIGPAQSGKSSMIFEILKNHRELFTTSFSRVVFCIPSTHYNAYAEYISKLKSVYPDIEIAVDIPKLGDLRADRLPKLFILGRY